MINKKKILLINWGTETSIHIFKECIKLKKYDFYLASTLELPEEIKELFGDSKIIRTNPYDPVKLCEDIVSFMSTEKIKFDVVTTFFEMCVYQTAFLAEFLEIKNRLLLKDALKTSVNKYLMRLELEKARIGQPKFFKFDENLITEAFEFFKNLKNSAIIKPVHSGHSYGVRYIDKETNFNDFKTLIDNAKHDYTRSYDEWMDYENIEKIEFVLEEFIDGKIYSFDGIVNGKNQIEFIGSTEFELSDPPIMQQVGHTIPIYSLSSKQIAAGRNYVKKIVEVLNLKYCGFHCEVKFKQNIPNLIEISGRLPGGVITSSYQNLSKYNVIDKFLSIFNEDVHYKPIKNKVFYKSETMKIIFSDKDIGIVKNSPGNVTKIKKHFIYKIRSRKEGEKISEKNNPFGVWLYEVILRSKKMESKELIIKRNYLVKKQKIIVINDKISFIKHKINKTRGKLKQYFAKIENRLIKKKNVSENLAVKRTNFQK